MHDGANERTNARIHECTNEWMNETNEIEERRIDWREEIRLNELG